MHNFLCVKPHCWNRYLRIFQYLLRLKRTQMELEKSWASAMHLDHSDFAKNHIDHKANSASQKRRQHFRPMWRVREHMAFLIRNLQFYIQVTYHENFSIVFWLKFILGIYLYICGIRTFLQRNASYKLVLYLEVKTLGEN